QVLEGIDELAELLAGHPAGIGDAPLIEPGGEAGQVAKIRVHGVDAMSGLQRQVIAELLQQEGARRRLRAAHGTARRRASARSARVSPSRSPARRISRSSCRLSMPSLIAIRYS